MAVVDDHLRALSERHAGATSTALPSGTLLVTLPSVALPVGWSKPSTEVRFLVPPAYPFAPPDCFWADGDLRLADGRQPQSSSIAQPIPEAGLAGLWFSWHVVGSWSPNKGTLSSWVTAINDRFGRLV